MMICPSWHLRTCMQAYVLDYNIYLLTVTTNAITTVTTDGHKNGISYGIPDWVYEGNNAVIKHLISFSYITHHGLSLFWRVKQ